MLTACIITKNQQKELQNCLEHLSKYHLPIVVVDTGSSDDSIEVARKYTYAIYEFLRIPAFLWD